MPHKSGIGFLLASLALQNLGRRKARTLLLLTAVAICSGAVFTGAAADRHRRQQQQRARLAPPEILQRQACQQESDAGFVRHRASPI